MTPLAGSSHPPSFPHAEYQARIARVHRLMATSGIDVLIVCDPANINYLTSYDAWSFYVPQAVVLSRTSDDPLWIGRPMDAMTARALTYLNADDVYDYPDDYIQSADRHAMETVAEVLLERGWHHGTIGVEMDNWYFTARAMDVLRRDLPSGDFVDSTDLVRQCRAIKSSGELNYMQQAAKLTDLAMAVAIERIGLGVRQCDVAAAVWTALIGGTEEFGGDYPASMPHFPAGRDFAHAYHLSWSDAPFTEGPVGLEFSGCRHRYHGPLARTVYLGAPPSRLLDAQETIKDGMTAAFELMKPGVTAAEVEAAWSAVSAPRGFSKGARIGYSVGLGYPPTWGEGSVSLRATDTTVLDNNMVFHFVPSFMVDDWGIEISETVVVTPGGGKRLSTMAQDVVVKR